jgi:hypothetical protein
MEQINNGAGFPTIQVIKALREATGLGLKDSKDLVDALKDKGTVMFDYTGATPFNTLPLEEYNFIRIGVAGVRSDVAKSLTGFAKLAVDNKEYTLAKTLIEFLEKL